MQRNAIRFIPARFNSRQSLYIQRRKTPLALLTDGSAASKAGFKFYLTPNDIILCEGGPDGFLNNEFTICLFDYDVPDLRAGFPRLCMKAAVDGAKHAPPYSGPSDGIPQPQHED